MCFVRRRTEATVKTVYIFLKFYKCDGTCALRLEHCTIIWCVFEKFVQPSWLNCACYFLLGSVLN